MTWVQTGDEQQNLDRILRSHSANRPVLRAHVGPYRAIMFGDSPLSRVEREAVAAAFGRQRLPLLSGAPRRRADPGVRRRVARGGGRLRAVRGLGPRVDAMCRYAVELSRNPAAAEESMLDGKGGAGLTAREIVDVNRVAQGLGVELEDYWPDDVRE